MRRLFLALLCCALSGLQAQEEPAVQGGPAAGEAAYQLGPGDRISISVFNQDDLSGNYALDGKARFSMPLIG